MNAEHLPEMILGKRVLLRKQTLSMAPEMFNAIHFDRTRLRRYLPWVDRTLSVSDEEHYIRLMNDAWIRGTHYDYGIFFTENNRFIGNVGLHSIDWKLRKCEMGYWIIGEYEGRGLMKEAVSALERAAFQYGIFHIEIRCHKDNLRSAQVPLALNYVQDSDQNIIVFRKTCH